MSLDSYIADSSGTGCFKCRHNFIADKQIFAYSEFFRLTCLRKNKMRLNAAKKIQIRGCSTDCGGEKCIFLRRSFLCFYFNSVRRITAYEPIPKIIPITRNERIGKNRLIVPSLINPIAFIINSPVLLTSSSGNTN